MPAGSSINTTGALTLVVAWGIGGRVHARKVQIGSDVESALRSTADEVTSSLTDGVPYNPDSDQEDATHVTTNRDDLLDTELIGQLKTGSSLPLASDDELRRPLTCYAAVIGSGDDKTVFVRKMNPIRLATKSVLAILITGALTRLETPLFAFEDTFDVIITGDDVFALHQKPFEMLFRDSDAVLAKAGEWVETLTVSLPITTSSRDALLDAVRSNSVYRRKVHSILGRGHLASLTPAAIKSKMSEHGLDPDRLMPGDELDFKPENTRDLLQLLNEDFFTGDFTDAQYAASAKRTRTTAG
ncbi:Kiwa anti-phage protein KwaB-like domain-containing protein [Flexivirga caeni]|uniref:DUF4868 domain-containing protein n=1 Tax=Flexivirga caeni TaxID=2294115 RepID=A0A3M9MIQ9_9MICO|nr:Kiwa anti-phage protein KwaB-like domain-containing protein [Flexivirga caeni]RNI25085.1 DUF4868 domain-containing protein [Flexivirga caeni]